MFAILVCTNFVVPCPVAIASCMSYWLILTENLTDTQPQQAVLLIMEFSKLGLSTQPLYITVLMNALPLLLVVIQSDAALAIFCLE